MNAHITADVIEITEFPELAQKYQIYGVPKTVINDQVEFEGALPEEILVHQVMSAVEGAGETEEPNDA